MDHQYINNTLTNAVSQTNGPAVPLGGKLYRILNGPPMSYTQMANSAFVQHDKEMSLNKENSLEGLHNDVHVMTGTGEGNRHGHMALNELAAFDPIFWLHHT
jgi:tyrosinase